MKRLILSIIILLTSLVLLLFRVRPIVNYRNIVKDELLNKRLIDLKDFKFLINSKICDSCCIGGLLLLIIVFSALENGQIRNEIRNSWGRPTECIKIVFLLGTKNDETILSVIQTESAKYGDILQGNFMDTYRNLTYKHLMGLKWVKKYCARASFVVKTDDDLSLYTSTIWMKLKKKPWGTTGLVACAFVKKSSSVQRVDSKWAVSKDEFKSDRYPVHCSGGGIVYSIDVVPRLLEASYEVSFYWIEDIYVTGMLTQQIGVVPVAIKDHWLYFDANAILIEEPSQLVDTELKYKSWRAKARRP